MGVGVGRGGTPVTPYFPYISTSSKMHYLCEPVSRYYFCRYLSSLFSRCTNVIPTWYSHISILYFWGMQELK